MGLYIERESSPITLDEWLGYIENDDELTLSENGNVINPITKAKILFHITGRAVWNGIELIYNNGRIRGDSDDIDGLIKKLSEIAAALSAYVYDCGERLGV